MARLRALVSSQGVHGRGPWRLTGGEAVLDLQRVCHSLAPATASFLARFEKQVDPLGVLEPEVRAKMADHARRAYMLQLAERSAKARKRAKATR